MNLQLDEGCRNHTGVRVQRNTHHGANVNGIMFHNGIFNRSCVYGMSVGAHHSSFVTINDINAAVLADMPLIAGTIIFQAVLKQSKIACFFVSMPNGLTTIQLYAKLSVHINQASVSYGASVGFLGGNASSL